MANKSAVIREYVAKHPDMGPTEMAARIKAERKLTVTPGFVTTVKSNTQRQQATESAVTRRAAEVLQSPNTEFLQALRTLSGVIPTLGGPDCTKDAVDLLTSLASRPN